MQATIGLLFDTEALPLSVAIATDAPDESVSGLYLTMHLPKSANPEKLTIQPKAAALSSIVVLYDQADRTCLIEALATAGASTYPLTLTLTQSGTTATEQGVTGTTVAVSTTW